MATNQSLFVGKFLHFPISYANNSTFLSNSDNLILDNASKVKGHMFICILLKKKTKKKKMRGWRNETVVQFSCPKLVAKKE